LRFATSAGEKSRVPLGILGFSAISLLCQFENVSIQQIYFFCIANIGYINDFKKL
jgi:hypothetical protein